jgi:hypothetical protein
MFTVSSPLAGISDLKLQLKKHEPIDPSAQAQIAWGVNTAAQLGEIFPSRSRGKFPPAEHLPRELPAEDQQGECVWHRRRPRPGIFGRRCSRRRKVRRYQINLMCLRI